MLSKEEIEDLKRLFYTNRLTQYGKRKLIANYEEQIQKQQNEIEQLEANNKNLIKKLEEDIRNANDNIKHMDEKNILQTIARELAIGMRDYAQEILKIAKREKE